MANKQLRLLLLLPMSSLQVIIYARNPTHPALFISLRLLFWEQAQGVQCVVGLPLESSRSSRGRKGML
jgi:hypothetical protein